MGMIEERGDRGNPAAPGRGLPVVTIDHGDFAFRYTLRPDRFKLDLEVRMRGEGDWAPMPRSSEGYDLARLMWDVALLRDEPSITAGGGGP